MRPGRGQPATGIMSGGTGEAYRAIPPDPLCRRCGMVQEEHWPLHGTLQKHHIIALRDGGHPTDPSNLYTLCQYCHREWHLYWERTPELVRLDWAAYMAATPHLYAVKSGTVPAAPPLELVRNCCRRCGISAERCLELRSHEDAERRSQRGLSFFRCNNRKRDETKEVCYWCQREWEVFWKELRGTELEAKVDAFFLAQPARLMAQHGRSDRRGRGEAA
eukprot:3960356-Prymnesium_polylepis.1